MDEWMDQNGYTFEELAMDTGKLTREEAEKMGTVEPEPPKDREKIAGIHEQIRELAGKAKAAGWDPGRSRLDVSLMQQNAPIIGNVSGLTEEEKDAIISGLARTPGTIRLVDDYASRVQTWAWIDVEDDLPDLETPVLCWLSVRVVTIASLPHTSPIGAWRKQDGTWAYGVTHWMPLPEGPDVVD